jgi:predicted ATP-binding protein involved in virulence
MKLKQISVQGLLGRRQPVELHFNDDLNILTGRNGSGKTTIMKLAWYVISGQIVRALTEVPFSRATITTEAYAVTVVRTGSNTCRVKWSDPEGTTEYEDGNFDEDGDMINAEDVPNSKLQQTGSSLFFPTFRRIEGGFATEQTAQRTFFNEPSRRSVGDLETVMTALSNTLSRNEHRFVSAVATSDIERLLLKQYTDASEEANRLQQETSLRVINEIKEFKKDKAVQSDAAQRMSAEEALDNIRHMIEQMEEDRQSALAQYNAIRQLVIKILQHSGIKVGRLSLGDAAETINSDALSAGEKQMLSFLCYNAFYKNAVIFIDEPELSLHVDWQRQLFPTLFNQRKSNQFIIATHSPFIYSKYPDKEIRLADDRGDNLRPRKRIGSSDGE